MPPKKHKNQILPNIGWILLSVILLVLSFPKIDWWILAWISLIPFFLALDEKSLRASLGWGYVFGLCYFGTMLSWLVNVDPLTASFGLPLLTAFLALYFLIFGWGYYFLSHLSNPARLFLIPCLWVALEYLRAHVLSGFSWASLGLSQYKNLYAIQIADITGMYGVSFLVVLVNYLLKSVWQEATSQKKISSETLKSSVIVGFTLVMVLFYGAAHLSTAESGRAIKVAVVQADIPQNLKWNEEFWPEILKKHFLLSKKILKEGADLILWPETAFPGFYGKDLDQMKDLRWGVQDLKTPLMFGAIFAEPAGGLSSEERYYNSAVFLSRQGEMLGQYNKIHLVPFGEYLPLRKHFPFLTEVVPIADFTAGGEYTVMSLPISGAGEEGTIPFSAFICFEDTIGHLVRKFANNGAQFFVNLTNDAWFGDTKAPYMHLQSSVFRAVENRRSVIRATNTGVSAFISPKGEIQSILSDASGDQTFASAVGADMVSLNQEKAFYTRFGDVFAVLCIGFLALVVFKHKK